jgi:hypothetical protein
MRTKCVLIGVIFCSMSTSAWAIIGSPTAELEQGQFSIGYDYTYSDTDLDNTDLSQTLRLDGAFVAAGTVELEISDFTTQRHYGSIHYGATDQWEAYFQIGIADLKAKTKSAVDDESMDWNFDNNMAWGFGTKYTFSEQDGIRWGIAAQMNWLDTSSDKAFSGDFGGTTYIGAIDVDIETYDLLIAAGPTVDMGGLTLYGGPFYYMLDGDLETCVSAAGGGSLLEIEGDGDLEEASCIGGFVGMQCMLKDKYDITTEISFTGEGWAVGGGIKIPF